MNATIQTQFNVRLSPLTLDQIRQLAQKFQISQSDVVRLAVADLAKRYRIK